MKIFAVLAVACLALVPLCAHSYPMPAAHEDCLERYDQGMFPEAEACLREDLAAEPENAYTLYLLAETVARDTRRFTEAEGDYEHALSSAESSEPSLVPEILISLGKLSIRLGENERAFDLLTEVISDWPEHYRIAEAYNLMGVALEKLDRFDEALTSFQRAIKLDPGLLEAGYNMKNLQSQLERLNTGRYYLRMGDLDKAEDHFREAVESHQNYVAAWFLLGEVSSEEGKHSEAIHCYMRVLALNPNYLGGKEPRYRLANLYLTRGNDDDPERAESLLEGLSYKDSDVVLGRTLVGLGRPAEAVEPLERVIGNKDLKADLRAEAHFQLGRAYRAEGENDMASEEFFQALRLMPTVEKYRHPPAE